MNIIFNNKKIKGLIYNGKKYTEEGEGNFKFKSVTDYTRIPYTVGKLSDKPAQPMTGVTKIIRFGIIPDTTFRLFDPDTLVEYTDVPEHSAYYVGSYNGEVGKFKLKDIGITLNIIKAQDGKFKLEGDISSLYNLLIPADPDAKVQIPITSSSGVVIENNKGHILLSDVTNLFNTVEEATTTPPTNYYQTTLSIDDKNVGPTQYAKALYVPFTIPYDMSITPTFPDISADFLKLYAIANTTYPKGSTTISLLTII